MLRLAIVFLVLLVIALIAVFCGFGGVANYSFKGALFVFFVLGVLSLVGHGTDDKPLPIGWQALVLAACGCFGLVGLVVGYLLSAVIGQAVVPGDNLGWLSFALWICPLTVAVFTGIGAWFCRRAVKKWTVRQKRHEQAEKHQAVEGR